MIIVIITFISYNVHYIIFWFFLNTDFFILRMIGLLQSAITAKHFFIAIIKNKIIFWSLIIKY